MIRRLSTQTLPRNQPTQKVHMLTLQFHFPRRLASSSVAKISPTIMCPSQWLHTLLHMNEIAIYRPLYLMLFTRENGQPSPSLFPYWLFHVQKETGIFWRLYFVVDISDQAILTFFLRPITGCLVKQFVNESREGSLKRFFVGAFSSLQWKCSFQSFVLYF